MDQTKDGTLSSFVYWAKYCYPLWFPSTRSSSKIAVCWKITKGQEKRTSKVSQQDSAFSVVLSLFPKMSCKYLLTLKSLSLKTDFFLYHWHKGSKHEFDELQNLLFTDEWLLASLNDIQNHLLKQKHCIIFSFKDSEYSQVKAKMTLFKYTVHCVLKYKLLTAYETGWVTSHSYQVVSVTSVTRFKWAVWKATWPVSSNLLGILDKYMTSIEVLIFTKKMYNYELLLHKHHQDTKHLSGVTKLTIQDKTSQLWKWKVMHYLCV